MPKACWPTCCSSAPISAVVFEPAFASCWICSSSEVIALFCAVVSLLELFTYCSNFAAVPGISVARSGVDGDIVIDQATASASEWICVYELIGVALAVGLGFAPEPEPEHPVNARATASATAEAARVFFMIVRQVIGRSCEDGHMADAPLFGIDTFGDVVEDDAGKLKTYAQSIRDLVDQAALADEVGIDAITIGEHHRPEFAVSSPEMVLSAIASRTERITLGSGVTVLSSDDPVRVFERFATLDAVSNGRAEVVMGRGSFTESFPLFGYELQDYDVLFEEKLQLWSRLLEEKPVTWSGTKRPALRHADVFPKTEHGLTTWVGVGGSPESVVRTARYGFGLMLAIIGGAPQRFLPYIDLYHRATEQLEKPALPIAVHSPGFIADTDDEAKELLFPRFKRIRDKIGAERGWNHEVTREDFEGEAQTGSVYVGSPETVARRIAQTIGELGVGRFDLLYSSGSMPHSALMHSVGLYGTKVIPMVKDMLS